MYENCDNHEPSIRTKYLYDAEGRVCAVTNTPVSGYSTMTGYIYNAEGVRVAKGTISSMNCDPSSNGFQLTESYVLGAGGEELSMLDGSGNWERTNVYAAGRLIGTYDLVTCTGSGGAEGACTPNTQTPALHFHIEDPLGTRRLQVSGNAAVLGQSETDIQSLPYGNLLSTYPDAYAPSTANDSTPLHFTGKERDSESGNDYFGARYYASTMGRWLSPDWSAKASPVPYATFDDPQSLNLYSYVRNNPLSKVDADGHCDWCQKVLNYIATGKAVTDAQLAPKPQMPAPKPPGIPKDVPSSHVPGPEYKTADAAAKAAIRSTNPQSVRDNKEIAGHTVQNDNMTYGNTRGPESGRGVASSDPGAVPAGTINAGIWHDHGANTPGYDNENFSSADYGRARAEGVPIYVGTPGGQIRKFDPQTNVDTQIGTTPH